MKERLKGGALVEGAAYSDGKKGQMPYGVKKGAKPNGWRASAAESLMRKGK